MDDLILPRPQDDPDERPEAPVMRAPDGELAAAMRHAATRAVVVAAVIVAAGLLLSELVTLIAAGVITLILAVLLSAVATPLERRGVPRPIGALIGLLGVLGVVAAVLAIVVPPLVGEARKLVDNLPAIVNDLSGRLGSLGGSDAAGERLQRSAEELIEDPTPLLGPLADIGLGVAGILAALIVILITGYYVAAMPKPLLSGALRLFPPRRRAWAQHVLGRIHTAWLGWMKGVLVDMAVTGTLLYAGLSLIGLDYAVLFAALSAMLVVVPYFGAIVGGFPPVLLALTESPELAALTFVVYLVVQQIEGNVIVPLVMARMVELHPALIAVGVIVVAQFFGIAGLLVAVPILSAVVIAVEELWVRPQEVRAPGASLLEIPDLPERTPRGRWARSLRARMERAARS